MAEYPSPLVSHSISLPNSMSVHSLCTSNSPVLPEKEGWVYDTPKKVSLVNSIIEKIDNFLTSTCASQRITTKQIRAVALALLLHSDYPPARWCIYDDDRFCVYEPDTFCKDLLEIFKAFERRKKQCDPKNLGKWLSRFTNHYTLVQNGKKRINYISKTPNFFGKNIPLVNIHIAVEENHIRKRKIEEKHKCRLCHTEKLEVDLGSIIVDAEGKTAWRPNGKRTKYNMHSTRIDWDVCLKCYLYGEQKK